MVDKGYLAYVPFIWNSSVEVPFYGFSADCEIVPIGVPMDLPRMLPDRDINLVLTWF